VAHSNHFYEYEERGGTAVSARELNVPEHAVVKTLVMEDENGKPPIVLMHGDCKVSRGISPRPVAGAGAEGCGVRAGRLPL
jgi:prolyl-tRNA editing enzyme YbaK/EbsC (Cys-tRNA(Pro) deacylase)